VGTWAASAYQATTNTPSKALTGNTLRQIVRVSIGGDTLRVKFSNITCAKAISIKAVTVAESPDGTKCPVTASTIKQLKFKGDSTVTIAAKSEVYSDPIAFNLKPSMRLAITIYYGDCQSSSDMTFHYGCRGNSYWAEGNKTTLADLGNTTIPMWFTICSVDVLAPKTAGAVVCFGNSITDGYGLSDGKQNRWTDAFSERLLANPATVQVGVLNEGIGGTCVLSASNGANPGTTRFQPDVLSQAGVRWIIVLYGVNDIHGGASADQVINGYKTLISAAHAKNKEIKIYGGTLTPMGGDAAYNNNEGARTTINNWIRTSGNFDGVIDFDKAVRNPNTPTEMRAGLANGLHPSVAGYKAMGDSIDLRMFVDSITTIVTPIEREKNNGFTFEKITLNTANGHTMINFKLPQKSFVSLKVVSMLGKEVAEVPEKTFSAGEHTIEFERKNIPEGTYLITLQAGEISTSEKVVFPIR
jgi:lysophospholipase L1-like esterase